MKHKAENVAGPFALLTKEARDAGISSYYARQMAAAGKVPTIRLGSRIHTIPGALKAAIAAELKGKRG
jgi:hypothetical protein